MKRGGNLTRRVSLKRAPLRQRRKPVLDARRDEFKRVVWGYCPVCGTEGRIRRHHVLTEQAVRREGGDPWDLRNSLWIGCEFTCQCHANHHAASHKIPLALVSDDAIEFVRDLLGFERALMFFARAYAGEIPEGSGAWTP